MPLHKNPCPGGHEIYKFGRPILGHHYYILGLSDQCLVSREENFFKKYINLTLFTPKLPPLGVGGHEIYNLSPYPTDATYSESHGRKTHRWNISAVHNIVQFQYQSMNAAILYSKG